MNPANSGLPPGVFPGQTAPQSKIKFAVITVLAVHALLLVGVLIQGCRQGPQAIEGSPSNAATPIPENPIVRVAESKAGTLKTPRQMAVPAAPVLIPRSRPYEPASALVRDQEALQTSGEYTVAQGD